MDQQEQVYRHLLQVARVSKSDCPKILDIMDKHIADSAYWKAVAERALIANNELRAEILRLNQIVKY